MHVSRLPGTVRAHSKLLTATVPHETKPGMSSPKQVSENGMFAYQVAAQTYSAENKPCLSQYASAVILFKFLSQAMFLVSDVEVTSMISSLYRFSYFIIHKVLVIIIVYEVSFIYRFVTSKSYALLNLFLSNNRQSSIVF